MKTLSMLSPELSSKIATWYKSLESPSASQHLLRCMIGGRDKLKKGFPKIYDHTWHVINYSILGHAVWDVSDRKIVGRKICRGLEVTDAEYKQIQAAFYEAFNFRDAVVDRRPIKIYHAFRKLNEHSNENVPIDTATI